MRPVLRLLLLAGLLAASTAAAAEEERRDEHRAAARAAPEFFALGDNPLVWDDDVLAAALAPHENRDPREAELFTLAGTLAAHLGLRPLEALHLPLPVNVLLIGFNGDGEANLTLSEAEVRRWLEGADGVLSQARRPREGLPPLRRGAEQSAYTPLLFEGESYVAHNLSVHAVQCGRRVTEVFERAVEVLARPEDPVAAEAAARTSTHRFHSELWYGVDAGQVSALLASLASAIGLDTRGAPVLALFNLRRQGLPARYGYRRGFSSAEVENLVSTWDQFSMDSVVRAGGGSQGASGGLSPTVYALGEGQSEASAKWRPPRSAASFSWSHRLFESEGWATQAHAALDRIAAFRAHLSPTQLLRAEAALALQPPPSPGPFPGAQDFGVGRELKRALSRRVPGSPPPQGPFPADCLTDTFVGARRVAWADLGAGPLGWGPPAAHGGLRTGALVEHLFSGPLGSIAAGPPSDHDLDQELSELTEERYHRAAMNGGEYETADDEVMLLEMELDVYETFALAHCSGRPLPPPLCDQLRVRVSSLESELATALVLAAKEAAEAAAEEAAAEAEAKGEDGAAAVAAARAAASAVKPKRERPHGWNIFSGDPESGAALSLIRDRFLVEIAQLLGSGFRHALLPVVSTGAYRRHDTLRLTLYDVAWGGGVGGGAWAAPANGTELAELHRKPLSPHAFDSAALQERLKVFLLPGQALEFTVTRLSASDDVALGAAISAAARSSASRGSILSPAGAHRYLDAHELHRQLTSMGVIGAAAGAASVTPAGSTKFAGEGQRSVLTVPLFVIRAQAGPPLYLDAEGTRTAASLGDMVVSLASPHAAQAAPTGFLCWAGGAGEGEASVLRTDLSDALPGALTALAAHLGGVRFSSADGVSSSGAQDDWVWSAGAHPSASTAGASGATAPSVLSDTLHRSIVVTSLDASLDEANAGVDALHRIRTNGAAAAAAGGEARARNSGHSSSVAMWRAYKSAAPLTRKVLADWHVLVSAWEGAVAAASALNYGDASLAAAAAEAAAGSFRASAQRLAERMHPSHCGVASTSGAGGEGEPGEGGALQEALQRGWALLQISVLVGLAAGGALVLVRMSMGGGKAKPKLN